MKTNLQQSFSVVVDVHCIYNVYVFATRTISTQLPPLHSAHSVMLLFDGTRSFIFGNRHLQTSESIQN